MNGVLLINLGTPTAPTTAAVRTYLREFLSDPRVLDISAIGRFLLLEAIILPFRPKRSAAAYASVWMKEGSPLMVHSLALQSALSTELGQGWKVALGMRYGAPSIEMALDELVAAGATRIVVMPLYPQYALSSTGTALEKLYQVAATRNVVPGFSVVPDFYGHSGYLDSVAALIEQERADFQPDHILFSQHGLPERQVRKSDHSGNHCFATESCCDAITKENRSCYRAQCMATARGLAERLGLAETEWSAGFQSRLGRTPWIQPYTDDLLPALAKQGVRRLLVSCPSFVADCLETLEEVGIRARQDFMTAGGEDLRLVPCVNSTPQWVQTVAKMARSEVPSPA